MLSGILNSDKAIDVNIAIMRAFVFIKQYALTHKDLTDKLKELESKYNKQFKDVYDAINFLLKKDNQEIEQKQRKRIGFKSDNQWFTKGESGNLSGRPQGARDKAQSDIKQAYQSLLEGNLSNIEIWLNEVAAKDPAKAIELMLRLSEFILPKMKATEITTSDNEGQPVKIVFTDFAEKRREENFLSKLSEDELRTLIEIQSKVESWDGFIIWFEIFVILQLNQLNKSTMKKIKQLFFFGVFTFLSVAFPFLVFSQVPLTYSEAIEVSGVNKDELFIRGREWFNDNFKSSKDVLQIADKESGELSGKGIMEVIYTYKYMGTRTFPANVNFQMNVWVKDGKFKYEMTNFSVPGGRESINFGLITTSDETDKKYPGLNAKKMNEMYLSIKQGIEVKAKLMIEDLKIKMAKKSKSTDW